ncbi:MAG: phosphate acyltransferase PlsX [Candidatus Thiodiazotropha sp. (ex Monitilora ramsayi)]|nr:phosphate acyltransferase PlsX [Candidatus Thiodiazotropha sp. (ex Monitilora ramsayi)]
MSKPVTISLDAMGGDFGAEVIVPAALKYLSRDKETRLILVGREEVLKDKVGNHAFGERLTIKHASETVEMDELPSKALRGKKDSSMRVAIDLVKAGEADACVSAGNTGALMATSRFVLKMLPNIDRPAIITALPSIEGQTYMLDLGANVDCTADHLFQFAVMGSEQVSAVAEIPNPRIGLLNIGQEEIKGNEQVKGAHELLSNSSLNYVGYAEGDDIYNGGNDVIVSDGFVGNIALKSSEGVAKMISHFMKQGFKKNILTMLAGLIALPVLRSLRRRIDPRRYNGASLLGLRGIVIKSHGSADELAYMNAISIAKKEVLADVPGRIAEQVKTHMEKREIA